MIDKTATTQQNDQHKSESAPKRERKNKQVEEAKTVAQNTTQTQSSTSSEQTPSNVYVAPKSKVQLMVENAKDKITRKFNELDESFESFLFINKVDYELRNAFYNKDLVAENSTKLSILFSQSSVSKEMIFIAANAEDIIKSLNEKALTFSRDMDFEKGMEAYKALIDVSKDLQTKLAELTKTISLQIEAGNASDFVQKRYKREKIASDKSEIIKMVLEGKSNSEIAQFYSVDEAFARAFIVEVSNEHLDSNMDIFTAAITAKKTLKELHAEINISLPIMKTFAKKNNLVFPTFTLSEIKATEEKRLKKAAGKAAHEKGLAEKLLKESETVVAKSGVKKTSAA